MTFRHWSQRLKKSRYVGSVSDPLPERKIKAAICLFQCVRHQATRHLVYGGGSKRIGGSRVFGRVWGAPVRRRHPDQGVLLLAEKLTRWAPNYIAGGIDMLAATNLSGEEA